MEAKQAGVFSSEPDVILAAMSEFLRRNRVDMMERFAREDIEWANSPITKWLYGDPEYPEAYTL